MQKPAVNLSKESQKLAMLENVVTNFCSSLSLGQRKTHPKHSPLVPVQVRYTYTPLAPGALCFMQGDIR
jgi:hypothetical protein